MPLLCHFFVRLIVHLWLWNSSKTWKVAGRDAGAWWKSAEKLLHCDLFARQGRGSAFVTVCHVPIACRRGSRAKMTDSAIVIAKKHGKGRKKRECNRERTRDYCDHTVNYPIFRGGFRFSAAPEGKPGSNPESNPEGKKENSAIFPAKLTVNNAVFLPFFALFSRFWLFVCVLAFRVPKA